MGSDTGDGWCLDCGDYFHLDDGGGYNPPCQGCGNCRSCCECNRDYDADEYGPDDGLDDEEREALARMRSNSPTEGGTNG